MLLHLLLSLSLLPLLLLLLFCICWLWFVIVSPPSYQTPGSCALPPLVCVCVHQPSPGSCSCSHLLAFSLINLLVPDTSAAAVVVAATGTAAIAAATAHTCALPLSGPLVHVCLPSLLFVVPQHHHLPVIA